MSCSRSSLILVLAAALGVAAPPPVARVSPADAAERADWSAVRDALAGGADAAEAQADGMTALHWAVYHDEEPAVKALLEAGAPVEAESRYGVRPIALAAQNGSPEALKLLLEAGADPETAGPGGETALLTAARTGVLPAVNVLLDAGADLNAAVNHQKPIHWAAAEGHAEVVERLIKAGADPLEALPSGFTPLFFAVREGHTAVVRTLLDAGADVNGLFRPTDPARQAPRTGTSPLLLAVINGHFELAAFLLDAGADPNAAGPGFGPLHALTNTRKPGVGDNDPPPEGSGEMSSLELVRKLVAHGADVNQTMTKRVGLGATKLNTLGATPFFLAAKTADVPLLELLAELGADPTIRNADNSTPLMAAAGLGTRSPGEDAGTEPEVIASLNFLLDLGADINAVDDNGETAMHGAAYKNYPAAVELLHERGAAPAVWFQQNVHGWTPVTIARGYRFGNFKPSAVTVAAFEKIMGDAFPLAESAESKPEW